MPNFTALIKAVLLYVLLLSYALLALAPGEADAVHPEPSELAPLAVPQHCHEPSDTSQRCRSLFALAQFVGFQNTPEYLFFVTHQLNHDYQLAPLQTAAQLEQDSLYRASQNDYINGVISRVQQSETMIRLVNEVLERNLAQLGVNDYVSAQYHITRLRVLSNLALANRPRHDALHVENEAAYLSHTLLYPDPIFMQTLSRFSTSLHDQRRRCLRSKTLADKDLSCASLYIVGDSFALKPTQQLEKVLAKLERHLLDNLAPTAAQRIAVSAELEDFDGYALSQRRDRAIATAQMDHHDAHSSTDADLQLAADYRAKDLALQSLHDTNIEQLQQDGFMLHIAGQSAGAHLSDYSMAASTTGTFDSLVDLYQLSQQLLQIWHPTAAEANRAGPPADRSSKRPSALPFAQTRSQIEHWVGVEDEQFDLLMQLHAQRSVSSEYQLILTQAGIQAWDLRPVVSQIYRNSDPNDYINVVHTGYTLPVHFNENTTVYRWRMRQGDATSN